MLDGVFCSRDVSSVRSGRVKNVLRNWLVAFQPFEYVHEIIMFGAGGVVFNPSLPFVWRADFAGVQRTDLLTNKEHQLAWL